MVVTIFIIGLIVGSFLNVVVMRLRSGENFMIDRSRCPQCKTQLGWHDNIPLVSFLMLGGKCRSCDKPISWHYPLVELITAVVFVCVALRIDALGDPLFFIVTAAFFSLLLIIFFYDLRYMEIPMTVLWSALVVAVIIAVLRDGADTGEMSNMLTLSSHLVHGLLSGAGAFAFFYALSAYSNETWMGMGDAYVGLVMGMFLGWPGIFVGLLIAFFTGAVVGTLLMVFFGKTGKTQIPFAPFLLFGLFCAFFFADTIMAFSDLLLIT